MGLLDTAFSPESLHNSFMKIRKDIHFKYEVQKYRLNEISEINKFRESYANGTFKFSKGRPFIIRERGKTRYIRPDTFRDRVVIHAFCAYLLKELRKYFIYDNCASLKGKGIDKQIDRVSVYLKKYYNKYHTNEGYVLQVDIKKYFDNIQHEKAIEMVRDKIPDEEIIEFLTKILICFEIRVSDAENMDDVFDSVKYKKDESLSKTLRKSVSIGNEVSQTIGLFYLHRIDNYAKNVLGLKYYGRYMDDIIIISNDRKDLENLLNYIRKETLRLGLYLNENKTHIRDLSKPFIFLKVKYVFTKSGKIILIKNNDTFIRERKKLRKLHKKYVNDELDFKYIESQYLSWRGSVTRKNKIYKNGSQLKTKSNKFKNKRQVEEVDSIYNKLFVESKGG